MNTAEVSVHILWEERSVDDKGPHQRQGYVALTEAEGESFFTVNMQGNPDKTPKKAAFVSQKGKAP